MKVKCKVNGLTKVFDCLPGEYLVDTLRKNNYLSVKRGCESSSCGVCTVLLDNKPILSCSFLTLRAEGHEILTVEGISKEAEVLSEYIGHEGADQCGFCNPGLALAVHALRLENDNPTKDEVKEYLKGNLCRCTGYQGQHIAIMDYLEEN